MLLYFPGQIASNDLDYVVSGTCAQFLTAHGIEEVSDVQISFVGWREGQQCYVASSSGTLMPVTFSRLIQDGGNPAGLWVPVEGPKVFTLPEPWVQPGPVPAKPRSVD